ncbi:ring-cleaving dioxygenase [Erysipelothrix amsterdamensis]|uniref:Ring-cleaving dioxygenase n=1 Tax=Erysipelothrix amsterdamensis TaxID=2929157 RepID=A0AAU9VF23_9FIRM|nr:ring-cleaving dioxygenase [Erysipelothrix sp. A18Y020d]CAH2760834.1 ring-cleaving dioxygenase [Erysipelothrix sp. A18Y020d]
MKQLKGLHHVTAITSSAEEIYKFYTYILGMRLVKKNINQDDIHTYHLYFADDRGNPGTNMTFFDFPNITKSQRGTNELSRTSFRVASDEALVYWEKRFTHFEIPFESDHMFFGKKAITFEDFDGQRYALVSDENNVGVASGEPWHKGPIPDAYAITGLGPMFMDVSNVELTHQVLSTIFGMRKTMEENALTLYEMGDGGNGGSVIVRANREQSNAIQGFGGVHHVAFRVDEKEDLMKWYRGLSEMGIPSSGYVERFYFGSLYIRILPNILFEIATDGPGFIDDEETYEVLGEMLTLPPHLRPKRDYIESQIKNFDTVRSTREFKKEEF